MALKCGVCFSRTNSAAGVRLPSLLFCKDYCKFASGRIRASRMERYQNVAILSAQDVLQRDSGGKTAGKNFNSSICFAVEQDRVYVNGALSDLVRESAMSSGNRAPEVSLREGRWVKLICGASFEDVVDIRNLSLVYTLAGVDCIDCAADSAVVAAVLEGVAAAQHLSRHLNSAGVFTIGRPWIMVSINDDEDPHFRKAEFDPELCPTDCPRPCERVCPAAAIAFNASTAEERLKSNSLASAGHSSHRSAFHLDGVITDRCYGCGRCIPVCPLGLIREHLYLDFSLNVPDSNSYYGSRASPPANLYLQCFEDARTYVRELKAVASLLRSNDIDAIEIHTGAGHLEAFHRVVGDLSDVLQSLKLIAVSVPDLGDHLVPALVTMYESLRPNLKGLNLWQLDGRPMSGDIGAGATKAAVALAARIAAAEDRPPGFLQLAGGTNSHTVDALEREGLFLTPHESSATIAGVAYGGYARKVVTKYLQKMDRCHETWDFTNSAAPGSASLGIEHYPSLLLGALQEATALVRPFKQTLTR